MKQWIKKQTGSFVVLALTVASAGATAVTGGITFSGGVTLNTSSANTATAVTGWSNQVVTSESGSFASVPLNTTGLVTLFSPWNFNTPAPGINDFWQVTSGGETFTFNLTQSSIQFQGGGFVNVVGTGMITGSGVQTLTATPGTWTFSTSDPGAGTPLLFSFQSALGGVGVTSVPENGMTVMLLGGALTGIGLLRHKLPA